MCLPFLNLHRSLNIQRSWSTERLLCYNLIASSHREVIPYLPKGKVLENYLGWVLGIVISTQYIAVIRYVQSQNMLKSLWARKPKRIIWIAKDTSSARQNNLDSQNSSSVRENNLDSQKLVFCHLWLIEENLSFNNKILLQNRTIPKYFTEVFSLLFK